MINNTKRNRNIGTSKQGYGQNNKMKIPDIWYENDTRYFVERVNNYKKEKHIINDHEFIFIIEKLLTDYNYACSVEDIIYMLQFIPKEDYGDLRYIVFRQPTHKEANLSSVWGRMIYSFEFENGFYPAIILESYPINGKLKWKKNLSIDGQKEFERLKNDGFIFAEDKRYYIASMEDEFVRNTQLYRTLPHEFGHYVQYLDVVVRPEVENERFEEWEKRSKYYFNIISSEKGVFAHSYAEKLHQKLTREGIIPFERKEKKS